MHAKQRLFLHIGTNKTASSTIQCFLSSRRAELSAEGLLYPVSGCEGGAHYGISRALGFDHGHAPAPETERRALLEQLRDEIAASRCHTALISSENFVLPKAVALVGEFFSDFDCRVVVYLRRHDHWWYSVYTQAVKMVAHPPWAPGFEAFLAFNRRQNAQIGDYRALLERWEAVFGRPNLVVRPYERQQNQPNIIADLFAAIGLGALYHRCRDREVPRINPSLGHRRTCLIETFQRMPVDEGLRQRLIRHAMTQGEPPPAGDPLSPELRCRLVEDNLAHYDHIARTYLQRPEGRLFLEALPDPRAAWTPPPLPTAVEVATVVAEALCAGAERGGSRSQGGAQSGWR